MSSTKRAGFIKLQSLSSSMRYYFAYFSFHQIFGNRFSIWRGCRIVNFLSTVFEILIWGILLFRHFGRQSLVIGDSKIGNYQFSFFKTSTAAE